MKAEILGDETLDLKAETETEYYALKQWVKDIEANKQINISNGLLPKRNYSSMECQEKGLIK